MTQEIKFCAAPDGTRLAYAKVGQGPLLVKAANWLSHLGTQVSFHWDIVTVILWVTVNHDGMKGDLS